MSEIVFNPPKPEGTTSDLQSQIKNLQTTLASLNQQVIILQEALQERDQEIAKLQSKLLECNQEKQALSVPAGVGSVKRVDDTASILGLLINLYQFAFSSQSNVTGKSDFPPGKEASA